MPLLFVPYDASFVASVRKGGPDSNGLPAERSVSDGEGNPCRACLFQIPKGAAMLVVAARPFRTLQPYAETGPIFLCAEDCTPWQGAGVPPVLQSSPDYLLRGYSSDNRIVSGSGRITPRDKLESYAKTLLRRAEVAYVDVRSSRNNCFLTRITLAT
jgi:hypothetical protein